MTTKTAIGSAMFLAADRAGAAEALHAELSESQAALMPWLGRFIPSMFDKAYRWVGEMEEIADFLEPERGEAEIYQGAARLYTRLAADQAGPGEETEALRRFLSLGKKG